MASYDTINHLYATQLGSVPTQADYDYWSGVNLQGDAFYNTFTASAQNDPRYGTTYNPATVGIDSGYNGTHGDTTWVNGVAGGGTQGGLGGAPANSAAMAELSGAVNTGFNTVNTNIDGVNNNITGLGTTVGAGFDATNQNLTTGFDVTNQNLATGLEGVGQNVTTGFAGQEQANADRQAINVGYFDNMNQQLAGLGTNMNQIGGNLDTYYGDLSGNQQTLLNTTDAINTGQQDFRDEYNLRTDIADRKRGELLDSVAGGTSQIKAAVGAIPTGSGPQGGNNQTAGFNPSMPQQGPQGQPQPNNPIVNTISRARDVLASTPNLSPMIGQQLSEFVTSFDANGQFMNQGMDAMGTPTIRNMSNDGNISIAKQNAQGQYITSGIISVPQIQSLLNSQSFVQGLGAN